MSQWGCTMVTGDGVKAVALVDTPAFAPLRNESIILDVLVLEIPQSQQMFAESIRQTLLERFQGKPYSDWALAFESTVPVVVSLYEGRRGQVANFVFVPTVVELAPSVLRVREITLLETDLSKRFPQEAADTLTGLRLAFLGQPYYRWLEMVDSPPLPDPFAYFQSLTTPPPTTPIPPQEPAPVVRKCQPSYCVELAQSQVELLLEALRFTEESRPFLADQVEALSKTISDQTGVQGSCQTKQTG